MRDRARARRLLAAAAGLAAVIACAAPARAARVVYALAIGVNQAPAAAGEGGPLARLRYADDDAVRYFQLFERFAADARLLTVLDAPTRRRYPGLVARAGAPTVRNLLAIAGDWARRMAADRARGDQPVLYLAFSGHGVRGRDGTVSLAMLDGGITRQLLHERVLAALPAAMVHLFVDACHAGSVVGVRGDGLTRELDATTAPVSPREIDQLLDATSLARFPTVGAVLATSAGEEAHEWSGIESGVFTHELLSALQGAADVNGDRRIEYSEVEAFIASANRGIRDPRAVPRVVARPPPIDRNAALIALDQIETGLYLEGDASALGHFYVELDDGQRLLDAHLAPGLEAALALPPGRTAFVRTPTGEAALPAGRRGRVRIAGLRLGPPQIAARGSIEASYRHALFASPFSRSYYQAYVDRSGASPVDFAASAPRGATAAVEVRAGGRRRPAALALAGLAGAALAASATTGVLALVAKRDFDATEVQREAYDARDRFERYSAISAVSAAVAVSAGVAAWWLWPRAPAAVSVDASAAAGQPTSVSLVVGGRW
jgi:hypothetical protein